MNSSIFNFEQLSSACISARRNPALVFSTLAAFLFTLICCSLILQNINNEPGSRLANINPGEVKVLILGNSQLAGINPAKGALNLSLAGSDYTVQYEILQQNAPNFRNMRLLVLGFDNIPLRTPAIDRMNGDYRELTRLEIPWYAIPQISLAERIKYLLLYNRMFKPMAVGPKLDLARLRAIREKARTPPAVPVGQQSGPDTIRPGFYLAPSQGLKKIRDYMSSLEIHNNYEENLSAFHEIIAYCSRNDIDVILVRPPATSEFRSGRSVQWQEELKKILADVRGRYPERTIAFWDADEAAAYDLGLFSDPNHLSPAGKAIYSDYLRAKLASYSDQE
jgi:hypothetical protein